MDNTTFNRLAQLETARPTAEEDLVITPDMDPAEALRRYKRSLDMPCRKPTPEEKARMEANPITPERATAVYRAYIARPDIDTRTLCDMPTEQLLELAADESEPSPVAEPAPAVDPEQPDPWAWLDEVDAWQDAHPGELYADRNGPPTSDEYRDPPQPETQQDDPQPNDQPTPPPVAVLPDDDAWVFY